MLKNKAKRSEEHCDLVALNVGREEGGRGKKLKWDC